MTDDCILCKIVKARKDLIYEDKDAIAVLAEKPAAIGHIIIIPKIHYQIIEQIPDYEIASLLNIANKISSAVFEALQVKGTNIMIQNGVAAGQTIPHVSIHIIPRDENDGINFQWQPKQLNEEQMSTVELNLKKGSESIGQFELEEKKEPIKLEKKTEKIKETKKGENYLIKHLERIP